MLKAGISADVAADLYADDLCSVVVKRYQEERPEVELTNNMLDTIWFSVYGKLIRNGKEKAYEYAKNTKLLW